MTARSLSRDTLDRRTFLTMAGMAPFAGSILAAKQKNVPVGIELYSVRGELVKAVIVLAEGATLTADSVREHCALRLAGFKVPSEVEFVEQLPYSATGKVRRATLRG